MFVKESVDVLFKFKMENQIQLFVKETEQKVEDLQETVIGVLKLDNEFVIEFDINFFIVFYILEVENIELDFEN